MVLLLIAYAFKQTNQRSQEKKLNVIVLLADDLGKHELSAYGGVHVPTPNIDSLGINGCVFNEGYATAAICVGGLGARAGAVARDVVEGRMQMG